MGEKNYQSIIGDSQLDLNFFSSCWDKILQKKSLREERVHSGSQLAYSVMAGGEVKGTTI